MAKIKKKSSDIVLTGFQISQANLMLLEVGEELEVDIRLHDSRMISDNQRKFIFALCRNLSDWIGDDRELIRANCMKAYESMFDLKKESLTEYTQTEASQLIDIIIEFTINQGITLGNLAQEYEHSLNERQTYSMALKRVCCVCGRKGADIHHVDHVGTRGNRLKISHIGLRALPLCRLHHTIAHDMPTDDFLSKHYLTPFKIDKKMELFIKHKKLKEYDEKG